MNQKETDLVVSILNYVAEKLGWNIDEEGFGYDLETLEIGVASDSELEEALGDLWNEVCESEQNKKFEWNEQSLVNLMKVTEYLCEKGYNTYQNSGNFERIAKEFSEWEAQRVICDGHDWEDSDLDWEEEIEDYIESQIKD